MSVWNIGNTTVRNPERLRDALALFWDKMQGRAFDRDAQREYQGHMIRAGLVKSDRFDGDDGGRKFGSAFKQLGFVTDWAKGREWTLTGVGRALIAHPEIEDTIFLRQLIKYQIASPLENNPDFALRPFRVLLRFLLTAYEEGLVGLTKFELALYVITIRSEDPSEFEQAMVGIREFRKGYDTIKGRVAKVRFASQQAQALAAAKGLKSGTLLDYADSNSRYCLTSGLLTLRGSKLAISPARLPYIRSLLGDGSTLLHNDEYLARFYDPEWPKLPGDDPAFLSTETIVLRRQLHALARDLEETYDVPEARENMTLNELQSYERRLRMEIKRLREIQFYRAQATPEALAEIEDLLEDIQAGTLLGGDAYAPAFFEWGVWRLLLAFGDLTGPVSATRGFQVDEDMQPVHHARGGAADLIFQYRDFTLVAEMTLMTGSRQFAGEGEPVTRHVFKVVQESNGKPIYGLFVARRLDPNTVDAFHNARYWESWNRPIATPVVALEIDHALAMTRRMRAKPTRVADLRALLDDILGRQKTTASGPEWYADYGPRLEDWLGIPAPLPELNLWTFSDAEEPVGGLF